MTYDLLIVWTEGGSRVVNGVSAHGITDCETAFYFEKNGYKSYVTSQGVLYFGRYFDWAG